MLVLQDTYIITIIGICAGAACVIVVLALIKVWHSRRYVEITN